MSYSPLAVSLFFDLRVRASYAVPEGIILSFFDVNLGVPGKESEWHVALANENHETPWEAPWGSINGPDFSRLLLRICNEIEEKWPDIKFPRG